MESNNERGQLKPVLAPLSIQEVDFSCFPKEFAIRQQIDDGISLLREKSATQRVEIGGLLVQSKGSQYVKPVVEGNELSVYLSYGKVTENNLSERLEMGEFDERFKLPDLHHVYFADSRLANQYPHYFRWLIQRGITVLLDAEPVASIHTHPQKDALPSPSDFAHVLFPDASQPARNKQIVVSSNWTYFLIPLSKRRTLRFGMTTAQEFE